MQHILSPNDRAEIGLAQRPKRLRVRLVFKIIYSTFVLLTALLFLQLNLVSRVYHTQVVSPAEGWTPLPKKGVSWYDIKLYLVVKFQFGIFEKCELTSLLPLLPGPQWPVLLLFVKVLSKGSSVGWSCRNTECISARRVRSPPTNECFRYDTKISGYETPFIVITPRSTLTCSGKTC